MDSDVGGFLEKPTYFPKFKNKLDWPAHNYINGHRASGIARWV